SLLDVEGHFRPQFLVAELRLISALSLRFLQRLGMVLHQIKAFHVDEHATVIGRAAWPQDADDRELASMRMSLWITMTGSNLLTEFYTQLTGDGCSDDRLEIAVLAAMPLKIT